MLTKLKEDLFLKKHGLKEVIIQNGFSDQVEMASSDVTTKKLMSIYYVNQKRQVSLQMIFMITILKKENIGTKNTSNIVGLNPRGILKKRVI